MLLLFSRALSFYEELVREDTEVFSEKLAELLKMIVRFYAVHLFRILRRKFRPVSFFASAGEKMISFLRRLF